MPSTTPTDTTAPAHNPDTPDAPPAPVSFPLAAFPPLVRDYLTALAANTHTSPDVHAATFLAIAGACIGQAAVLVVREGWIERPVLWVAVIGGPDTAKTPALSAAFTPLDDLDACLARQRRATLTHPALLHTTGPTVDRILARLAANPAPFLCLWLDDLTAFTSCLHNRHAQQQALALWSHLTVHVPQRNRLPVELYAPVLTIAGALRETAWQALHRQQRFEPGLAERFLPVVLPPEGVHWRENDHSAPLASDALLGMLQTLTMHPANQGYLSQAAIVDRHPDAIPVWTAWFDRHVDRTRAAAPARQGAYRKLPAQVARIALILHCLWNLDDLAAPLSCATMCHAVAFGDAFRTHIDRASALNMPEGGPPAVRRPPLASTVVTRLASADDPEGWVTRTDLYERTGRPARAVLTETLATLIAQRVVETRQCPAMPGLPGRKRVNMYRIRA